jgi:ribosome-binding protein aMBF1 (putative translation factor)
MPDFLDEIVRDRSAGNPEFDRLVDAAARRRAVIRQLAARRASLGLSQTAVAARMRTSQPVVARLESGDLDSRLSTIERYAAAVGLEVDLVVREPVMAVGTPTVARGVKLAP